MTVRKGILFFLIVLALAACNTQPIEVTRVPGDQAGAGPGALRAHVHRGALPAGERG